MPHPLQRGVDGRNHICQAKSTERDRLLERETGPRLSLARDCLRQRQGQSGAEQCLWWQCVEACKPAMHGERADQSRRGQDIEEKGKSTRK